VTRHRDAQIEPAIEDTGHAGAKAVDPRRRWVQAWWVRLPDHSTASGRAHMDGPQLGIVIDMSDAAAPYEQIRVHIADQARSGRLPSGTRLPTVRRLAEDLHVAPGTVARAYRTLESDGVIETRGRHGTFVAANGDATARAAFAAAVEYVGRAQRLGLDRTAMLAAIDAALTASAS
jgi:DNA-binding transcriptional regulator YhcF (GntR family)